MIASFLSHQRNKALVFGVERGQIKRNLPYSLQMIGQGINLANRSYNTNETENDDNETHCRLYFGHLSFMFLYFYI